MCTYYVRLCVTVHTFIICVSLAESGRVKRVVGGMDVECGIELYLYACINGTQPRIVSLTNSTTSQHLCGATVVSPEYAITAAHCVHHRPSEYQLKLSNSCLEPTPNAQVLQVIPHEHYDKRSHSHDIAILRIKLEEEDELVMSLAGPELPASSFGVSGDCTIFGYGSTNSRAVELPEALQAASVRIASLDLCVESLGPIAPKAGDGMLCALGEASDSCQGDSGSPLVCGSSLEALSSYGMSCGVRGVPGVYTSIGAHLPWIRNVIL